MNDALRDFSYGLNHIILLSSEGIITYFHILFYESHICFLLQENEGNLINKSQ